MKQIQLFIVACCLTLLQQQGTAQEWIRQYPYPILGAIEDIIMKEDGNGWAVGGDRSVLRTSNFGEIWEIRTIEDDSWVFLSDDLLQVLEIPGTNAQSVLVSTKSFNILRTTDDGNSWEKVLTGQNLSENFHTLALINDNTIAAVGKDLYISTDQGSNWDVIALPGTNPKRGFFLDDQNWWVIESAIDGQIYHTTDGGLNWSQVGSETFNFAQSIHFFDTQHGLALSNDGLFQTQNGGTSWTMVKPFAAARDWYIQDENTFFICRENGVSYTTDAGNSWTEKAFGFNAHLSCTALPGERFWVGGSYCSIHYSEDLQTWNDQVGGVKAPLRKIYFTDENNGFAFSTIGSYLLQTNDGGAIWELVDDPLLVDRIWRAGYADHTGKVILVDISGHVFLSEDHGASWQMTGNLDQNIPTKIIRLENGTLYLLVGNGKLWTSSNGGYQWDSLTQVGEPFINDIVFPTDTEGWLCGSYGQLYHTTDGGLNWTAVDLNTTNQLKHIEFINEQKGFVFPHYGGPGKSIWVTEDGGQTWEATPVPPMGFIHDVEFSDENYGWMAGGISNNGRIYATTDGGQTWDATHLYGPEILNALACPIPGETAWAAGPGGQILKWITCEEANDPPMLTTITPEAVSPCIGDTINLTLSSSNVDIFQWILPSDWILLGNDNTALIEVIVGMESGTVTAIGQNACGEEDSVDSEPLTPVVKPEAPTLVLNNTHPPSLEAQGQADTYRWFLNDVEIPGENGSTLIATENGTYTVVALNGNECVSELSNAVEVTTVSTYSLSANTQPLHITPNPATGSFTISHLPQGKQATLLLYNTYGKTVFKREFLTNGSALLVEWQDYKPGLYYLRLETAGQVYAGKIVFQ